MKKVIRLLGATLVVVSLNSCTGDDVPSDGAIEFTQKNLEGVYKFQKATVPIAVDLDNDGITNTNLLLELGKSCVWDNTWKFAGPSMYLDDIGIKCDPNGSVRILDESITLDKNTKTIIFDSGDTEPYTNVELSIVNGLKTMSFQFEDKRLKQKRSYTIIQVK